MKTAIYFLLTTLLLATTSCTIDAIPDEDTAKPVFTLRIQGDGFDRTFSNTTDFSSFVLNLRSDVVYDFSFNAFDIGGLRQMYIGAEDGRINLPSGSPWVLFRGYLYDWFGDEDNPVSINGVDGTLTFFSITGPDGTDHVRETEVVLGAQDYGGTSTSGIPNNVRGSLQLDVRDQPTEIVPID